MADGGTEQTTAVAFFCCQGRRIGLSLRLLDGVVGPLTGLRVIVRARVWQGLKSGASGIIVFFVGSVLLYAETSEKHRHHEQDCYHEALR